MKEEYSLSELTGGAKCDFPREGDSASPTISFVTADSRQVKEGTLFAAIKGFRQDGHDYIPDVIKKGARALLVQNDFDEGKIPAEAKGNVFLLKSHDTRESFGVISSNYFGNPSGKLKLIGVTGTNGKTTTAYIINSILETAGITSGLMGTIIYKIADEEFPSSLTTPDAFVLNRYLSEMVNAGVSHSVMEVSSHAIHLNRIAGCSFHIGIFTNLSREHMDFHRTMEDYYKCKKTFFDYLAQNGSSKIIVNIDDEWGRRLAEDFGNNVITYSYDKPEASVKLVAGESFKSGVRGSICTGRGAVNFSSSLGGRFNFYNILAAVAACAELEIPHKLIGKGIDALQRVPGRFERIENSFDFDIIVDYAHTPDALEKLLTEAKKMSSGRLITLFGCGGDRDKDKRPLMGKIAARLSDSVVITSDNPRNENPESIIEDILKGIDKSYSSNVEVIEDRKTAIKSAVNSAKPGDTVVIAGKGHEDYQIVGEKILRLDDREEVLKILEGIRNSN